MKKVITYCQNPELARCGVEGFYRLMRRWVVNAGKRRIIIHAGFVTDLATLPWIARLFGAKGNDRIHRAAAIVHDFLYTRGGNASDRKYADGLYRRMLREAGASRIAAGVEYYALRLFGWSRFGWEWEGLE